MLDLTDTKFKRFGNVDTLGELIPLIKRNQIIPFIGAGMSFKIYSSWGDALKRMMKGHFDGRDGEAKEIEAMIESGDFDAAAQKINEALRNLTFHDRLVAIFNESLIKDEHLKKMPVRYLPKIFTDTLVVTTNFDKVLERVFLLEQHPFEEKLVLNHLTNWQSVRVSKGSHHYLIKIHGCVSAPDEVVMTKTSYEKLYRAGSKAIRRLNSVLSGHTLLFIGCSLNKDRTVGLLEGVNAGGHYAILEMDGKAGEAAFEKRREYMDDKLQMHCIWYPKGEHHYVEDILEYICADITGQLKTAGPVAAPSRAGRSPSPAKKKEPVTPPQPVVKPFIRNETYTMGRWAGKPLEWLILDVQPDKVLLIAKDCLLTAPYNVQQKDITWEKCTLRKKVLPDLLQQIFDDSERNRVLQSKNQNPDNAYYETSGGADTDDSLFLLSIDEVIQHFPYDSARIAKLNNKAVWWWLRSPGYGGDYAAIVSPDGGVYGLGSVIWPEGAVRPAFWLNLQS